MELFSPVCYIAIYFLAITGAAGLRQYADKIPNGATVPNPGPQGGVWAGVGHLNAGGGGENNQFGLDFAANGHEWTTQLCETDSDGDGRSNGEELGDPNCDWVQGTDPAGPAVSHPGVSDEPNAKRSQSNCDDYVTPENEITMDIGFSVPTQMDGTRTHYICEQRLLDVPMKTLLHKTKHSVILDNKDVLHHMFVYICPAGSNSTDGNKVGRGPYECSGNESGCRRVGGWAVGPYESCKPPNVGQEIDFTDMDQVVVKIEAHYDNAVGMPQQDQSGIRLHMTPTLRPLASSSILAGKANIDADFVVLPGYDSYPLTGLCPSAITELMTHAVYVFEFTPHMHLYGRSMVTEHYRCGKKIGELGRIGNYEFDNQQSYILDPPVKLLPGDALVTRCGFNTSGVDFNITGGDGTTDEMCLNFMSAYPKVGTPEAPTLMSACMSIENGIKRGETVIPIRVAAGDMDFKSALTQNYVSDPELSVASCCAANNCEELYRSDVDGACGIDADCMGGLVCSGGLCKERSGKDDSNAEHVVMMGLLSLATPILISICIAVA